MRRQNSALKYLLCKGALANGEVQKLRSTFGDDAATALLIDNMIQEDALLEALAEHFQLPPAGYREGLFIEEELLERIDRDLIDTYEILPVRRRGQERIDLLVVEPLPDSIRQRLEVTHGVSIREYIWPRLRFLHARHFFLGNALPQWARNYLRSHPVTLGFTQSGAEIDLYKALESSQPLTAWQWELHQVERFIKDCFDRDALLKVLLGFSARWLTRRLIVVIGKRDLQPHYFEDWPELEIEHRDLEDLRRIRAKSEAIKELRQRVDWLSGSAHSLGLAPLFEALKTTAPPSLVAIPVQIRDRSVMLMLGQPADPQAALRLEELSESFDGDELQQVATWVGAQLEEIIHLNKLNELPPKAARIPPLPQRPLSRGLGFDESLVEQMIARRGPNQERHRWEIVDISEASEEPAQKERAPYSIGSQVFGGANKEHRGARRAQSDPLRELHIPTDASGLPMAQIFRRPKRAKPQRAAIRADEEKNLADDDSPTSDQPTSPSQTLPGLGEVKMFSGDETPQSPAPFSTALHVASDPSPGK